MSKHNIVHNAITTTKVRRRFLEPSLPKIQFPGFSLYSSSLFLFQKGKKGEREILFSFFFEWIKIESPLKRKRSVFRVRVCFFEKCKVQNKLGEEGKEKEKKRKREREREVLLC